MRSKTGHEESLSDVMTMMCEFSANVLMDVGHPITSSLSFLSRRRRSANAQTRLIIELDKLCTVGPHGTLSFVERGDATASIVHELNDQWPDVFGAWLMAHLLRCGTFTAPSEAIQGSALRVVGGCADRFFRWIAHVSAWFQKNTKILQNR